MTYIGSLDYDEQLKDAEEIVIFGGGAMLFKLLQKMERLNLAGSITAICDNNTDIQGKKIQGIPVLGPDRVLKEYRDCDFIVYNKYFMEICEQLHGNHIAGIHLIRQGSI